MFSGLLPYIMVLMGNFMLIIRLVVLRVTIRA